MVHKCCQAGMFSLFGAKLLWMTRLASFVVPVSMVHCNFAVGQAGQSEAQELTRHLNETSVAVKNRFIPIFMVPEAAQYRNEQKHLQLQRHHRRKHAPDVIRAAPPVQDHVRQRELLSASAANATVKDRPVAANQSPQDNPSNVMMIMYGLRNAALSVWYWLPTSEEVLLWLSEYIPVADVLIMDYFRLRLGSRPLQKVVFEIPVDPLDQALHDAWLHR